MHQKEAGNVDLWPEHIEAFELFADCATQWRIIAGPGGLFQQGLDYSAVEAAMRMRATEKTAAIFAQVRKLEQGALSVMNG